MWCAVFLPWERRLHLRDSPGDWRLLLEVGLLAVGLQF